MCVIVEAGTSTVTAVPLTTPPVELVQVVCLRAYAGEPPVLSFEGPAAVPGAPVVVPIHVPSTLYASANACRLVAMAMAMMCSLPLTPWDREYSLIPRVLKEEKQGRKSREICSAGVRLDLARSLRLMASAASA
jgi:hypothetical protein